MKLEDQVVSLELSKQLKASGFKQEGLWWWFIDHTGKHQLHDWKITDLGGKQKKTDFVAPTVAELINMLTKLRKGDIIIPENISNVADYLAQEVLNEKSKV